MPPGAHYLTLLVGLVLLAAPFAVRGVNGKSLYIQNDGQNVVEITDGGAIIVNQTDILAELAALKAQVAALAAIVAAPVAPTEPVVIFPPGTIQITAASAAPSGWLLCDGAQYLRSAYPDLFLAIGTAFNPSVALDSFNVPDLRGRVPLGAGAATAATSARAVGQKDGAETHKLTVDEMPSHTHADNGHSHNSPVFRTPYDPMGTGNTGNGYYGIGTSSNLGSANGFASLANTGSSLAHNNMQPFTVVNFIIKT